MKYNFWSFYTQMFSNTNIFTHISRHGKVRVREVNSVLEMTQMFFSSHLTLSWSVKCPNMYSSSSSSQLGKRWRNDPQTHLEWGWGQILRHVSDTRERTAAWIWGEAEFHCASCKVFPLARCKSGRVQGRIAFVRLSKKVDFHSITHSKKCGTFNSCGFSFRRWLHLMICWEVPTLIKIFPISDLDKAANVIQWIMFG